MPFLEIQLPSGHRNKVEVNINSFLISVLDEICIMRNLNIDYCYLTHNKTILDLSIKFGMSKLINNSKLELVISPISLIDNGIVNVNLQLSNNTRINELFNPKDMLWDILLKFSESNNEYASLIFPQDSNLTPVIFHLHEQIFGEYCLRNTSLASLGIRTGRVLFRLEYQSISEELIEKCNDNLKRKLEIYSKMKNNRDIKEELPTETSDNSQKIVITPSPDCHTANICKNKAFISPTNQNDYSPFSVFPPNHSMFDDLPINKKRERQEKKSETLGELMGISLEKDDNFYCYQNSQSFLDFKFPDETAGKNLMDNDEPKQNNFIISNENRESVFFYRKPMENIVIEDVPDSFFEVTEQDIRQIIKGYRESAESDAPLITKAMKEQLREANLSKYKQCIIQFHFQDAFILQSVFNPQETVADLYNYLKMYLRNVQYEFYLYTTPPKEILKNTNLTLIKSGLVPMSKIYVSSKAKDLYGSNLESAVSMGDEEKARKIVAKLMNREHRESSTEYNVVINDPTECGTSGAQNKGSNATKVPKWFKKCKTY